MYAFCIPSSFNYFITVFCPPDYCFNGGTCGVDGFTLQLFCGCIRGQFTGDRCEVEVGGLDSGQAGGLSAGLIVGIVILIIIVVAVIFMYWKVVHPYIRRRRHRSSSWYVESNIVHENPAALESLLRSKSLEGLKGPLDNPLYESTIQQPSPAVHSFQEDDFQTGFNVYESAQFNTVIINRQVNTETPDILDNNADDDV
jgi:hypothetical protein